MKKGLMLCLAGAVLSLVSVSSLWAEVVRGKITAMDLGTSKLSVQAASGETLALSFDKEDFIVWKGDDEVDAKEIQVGGEAEVGYYADENGAKIASWVDLTPLAEESAAPAPMEKGMEMAPEAATAPPMEQPAMAQPETSEQPGMMQPAANEQKTQTSQPAAKEHPGKEHPGH